MRFVRSGVATVVAALVFCHPQNVDWNVVHGRVIIRNGELLTLDLPVHIEKHNRASRKIING